MQNDVSDEMPDLTPLATRFDNRADLVALCPSHRMDMLGVIRKRLQRVRYVGATRAGDEDKREAQRHVGSKHDGKRHSDEHLPRYGQHCAVQTDGERFSCCMTA